MNKKMPKITKREIQQFCNELEDKIDSEALRITRKFIRETKTYKLLSTEELLDYEDVLYQKIYDGLVAEVKKTL